MLGSLCAEANRPEGIRAPGELLRPKYTAPEVVSGVCLLALDSAGVDHPAMGVDHIRVGFNRGEFVITLPG